MDSPSTAPSPQGPTAWMRVARRNCLSVQIWVIWTLGQYHNKIWYILDFIPPKLNIHLFHQTIWSAKFVTLIMLPRCYQMFPAWTFRVNSHTRPMIFRSPNGSSSMTTACRLWTWNRPRWNIAWSGCLSLVRLVNPFCIESLCRVPLVIPCCRNYQRSPNSNSVWNGWEQLGSLSFRPCLNGDRSAKIERC